MIPFDAFLQVRAANGGTFSPDGRTLVYLSNETGVPQVYRQELPGPHAVQLTDTGEIVRAVHWSPDGRRLLFTMDAGGSEHEQLYLLDPQGGAPRALTAAPEAIHTFGAWSPDSRSVVFAANRRNRAYFDIYTLDVDTGEERCVLERDGYFTAVDWSPDGERLVVREHLASFNQELHLLDLASGELALLTSHKGNARYPAARFLPDSRHLLVVTDQDRDHLAVIRLDSQTLRRRSFLEKPADVESLDLTRDGQRAVMLLNREGWSELLIARVTERSLAGLVNVRLPGVASHCRIAADGSQIALSFNGPAQNFQVWAMDPDGVARTQWSRAPMGDLDRSLLVEPELVRYPTHDGLKIPAWLYRPRGVEGPLPVVVHVHGGPESQDRPNFNAVYQYLAHRGYAVLAPNVRGSSGYGNHYAHLDDREKRYDALADVERAYHWLVAEGIGDPRRIGIMGGSYGGFTVLYCLTRQPDLWAAGVDIVGVANFETFFKHTGPYRRHLRASEYGDPERDRDLLRDLSPIHRVDQIRAPLLVIQGANDPRVPQEESDQMVESLRARSHPVEYLLYPDEGHGIVKLSNRIHAYTAVGEFLDRYLGTRSVDT